MWDCGEEGQGRGEVVSCPPECELAQIPGATLHHAGYNMVASGGSKIGELLCAKQRSNSNNIVYLRFHVEDVT